MNKLANYLIKKAVDKNTLIGSGIGAALGGLGAYAFTSPEENEPYTNYDYRRIQNALIAALVTGGAGAAVGNYYGSKSDKGLTAEDLKAFGLDLNTPLSLGE